MPEQPTPTPVADHEEAKRPDPLALAVAEAVARLRRQAGLSERAAARKLGTSQTQLRRMEDPRYLPSLRSLARVAAAYGHRLDVEFQSLQQPAKPKRAMAKPARSASRSSSPSKGRRAAPGPARGGARRKKRGAGRRRRN